MCLSLKDSYLPLRNWTDDFYSVFLVIQNVPSQKINSRGTIKISKGQKKEIFLFTFEAFLKFSHAWCRIRWKMFSRSSQKLWTTVACEWLKWANTWNTLQKLRTDNFNNSHTKFTWICINTHSEISLSITPEVFLLQKSSTVFLLSVLGGSANQCQWK